MAPIRRVGKTEEDGFFMEFDNEDMAVSHKDKDGKLFLEINKGDRVINAEVGPLAPSKIASRWFLEDDKGKDMDLTISPTSEIRYTDGKAETL